MLRETLVGGGGVECERNALLTAGGDVRLTLDTELQTALYAVAETAARNKQARQVHVIVINPKTGAIRAAVQIPAAHGASSRSSDISALTWRSVIDVFEPGGLLQPLVIATALDQKVIAPETLLDCEGGTWTYCGTPLRDPHPFDTLTPAGVLVNAGNIGMAKIGLMVGEAALYQCILDWGVDRPYAIGLGAGNGTLRDPSRWLRGEPDARRTWTSWPDSARRRWCKNRSNMSPAMLPTNSRLPLSGVLKRKERPAWSPSGWTNRRSRDMPTPCLPSSATPC